MLWIWRQMDVDGGNVAQTGRDGVLINLPTTNSKTE